MDWENGRSRPRIAVTHDPGYVVDAYLEALQRVGADGVALSAESVAPQAGGDPLAGFDGLLLAGGVDVNPALYGQEPHVRTEEPDSARDEFERSLLGKALERDLPVLAICRGLQLMNVVHGGTLIQHLDDYLGDSRHVRRTVDKAEPAHPVHLEPGTVLAGIFGAESVDVNSRHHQAVDRVGDGLRVSASAADGIVEGLERSDRNFAVAVQWHPENMAPVDALELQLFRKFIEAAGAAAH